jgi:hypothetical protein
VTVAQRLPASLPSPPLVQVDVGGAPKIFSLSQNYHNPFDPTTTIGFSIVKLSIANLKMFDLLGRKVETLVNSQMEAGTHEVSFDTSRFASGIYFYRLRAANINETKRLDRLKEMLHVHMPSDCLKQSEGFLACISATPFLLFRPNR